MVEEKKKSKQRHTAKRPPISMTSIQAQKKALRRSILVARKNLSSDYLNAQSERITAALLQTPEFAKSQFVSCYLSMEGEVNTSGIVREVLSRGKGLFVPKVDQASGLMQMLRIYDLDDLSSLPAGLWGIREPDSIHPQTMKQRQSALDSDQHLDLIVMPGVAFDRSFSRLGYGRGFYDRFLSAYQSAKGTIASQGKAGCAPPSKAPFLVALAFREQLLEGNADFIVPIDATDQKVDAIVSPAFEPNMVLRSESDL